MVKIDIARKVHRQEGILVGEAEQLISALIEMIKEKLESGEEVLISGFGKFQVREKKARPGRDPDQAEIMRSDRDELSRFHRLGYGARR